MRKFSIPGFKSQPLFKQSPTTPVSKPVATPLAPIQPGLSDEVLKMIATGSIMPKKSKKKATASSKTAVYDKSDDRIYMEHTEDGCNKFYEVRIIEQAVLGYNFTVFKRYGVIGTSGATLTTHFTSLSGARWERDKMVKAKLKKGYYIIKGK